MKRKFKIAFFIVALMLVMAFIAEWAVFLFLPRYIFKGAWVVPLYFGLFYVCASFFITPQMTNIQMTRTILGLKSVKIFSSLIFVTIASLLMRDNVIAIVINFIIYYMLLLVPECAYFIYMKKHIKD